MGSRKFPDGIDLIGDFSEAHARNLANSIRAFQTKALKGEFSVLREEVRRNFEAPAQSSSDPNPVLSSAAEAPGTGVGQADQDAMMPDAEGSNAAAKASTPTSSPSSMPPPTYVPPSAKVKAQQRVVARTAPLAEPFVDPKAQAFAPLSPVAEIPVKDSSARANVPPAGRMPQALREAKDDPARRRPFIYASAYAIPIRLPAFIAPGVLHPNLEDSMVAASVCSSDTRATQALRLPLWCDVQVYRQNVDMRHV